MRTFISGLLTLIAMAAIVIAVPSVWTKERIVDPEGFATLATQLAADTEVKDSLAAEVSAAVETQTGVPIAGQVAESATRAYMNTPQYEADFADVLAQQHAWLFDPPPAGGDTSVMQLDITAMVNRVIAQTGIAAQVNGPILVPINSGGRSGLEAGRYHEVGQQITTLAFATLAIAIVAGLLALLIARRRGTVVAWLGVGLVLAAAFAWVVGLYFSYRGKQEVDGTDESGRKVSELMINAAVGDLHHVAMIVAAVGVVVILLGVLVRLFARH
ncbi:hypothetical protein AAFP30_10015 [Gordonia sp. CPCC 205515]|uniref:hypothetical protein n=1 Tax=Gordonia sp. CPCC 205515 TaxID=3140791 RepID=UPI003AF35BB2